MATNRLSLKMQASTLEQLETRSREQGEPVARLAERYIEEGLRLETHPGIVFRDGPTGRRAAIAHGPDVWEAIPVIKNVEAEDEQALEQAARRLGLTTAQVYAAVRYYAKYRDEIDARARDNEELAARLEAEWLRQQAALAG